MGRSNPPAAFDFPEWIHPDTGKSVTADDVTGGADRKFVAPFDGDAVLYLSRR